MTTKPADQGFTIVELLIALSIASLIMTMITGVVHFSRRAIASTSDRVDQMSDLAGARQFLLETLAQVSMAGLQASELQVSGDTRQFTLLSVGPRVLALPGPEQFTFTVDTKGLGMAVRWHSARQMHDGVTARQLVRPVRKVSFRYFVHDRGWVDQWTGGKDLPSIVQIHVDGANVGKVDRGDILIPVRLLRPSECGAAPNPARCQDR